MRRKILIILLPAFLVFGLCVVRGARAMPATTWMNIYDPSDFKTPQELYEFIRDLRVPIPVILSAAEILNYQLAGNLDFTLGTLYRASLVLVYLLAIYLSSSPGETKFSPLRSGASFGLALIFLGSTVLIHPGNAQPYDIAYPLFILLYILCLTFAASEPGRTAPNLLWSALAGLSLSLAELSRPFFILILPLLVVAAYLWLRQGSRKMFLSFIIPIILLSGGWHLHQWINHGQWSWSNHSGFNLWHAWALPMQSSGASMPELLEEQDSQPVKPGRWANLNNTQHAENSRRMQQAVLSWMAHHPMESLVFALRRLGVMMIKVKTEIYTHHPQSWLFWIYRPAVWLSAGYLFLNALFLFWGILKKPAIALAHPENQLVLIAVLSILFLALGEAGEEARFLISVLPLLTVLPQRPLLQFWPLKRSCTWRARSTADSSP
jgi:4-amino-4-deoxy-L-arabinose transferase-like glycosyltransferase